MKKFFNKKAESEKTEEEIAAAEEKKAKLKKNLIEGAKVVVGIVVFAVGALLVAAAMNVDPDNLKQMLEEGDGEASDPEDVVFVDEEITTSDPVEAE